MLEVHKVLLLVFSISDSKKVRPLTLADIESGMYTVHDVVLPLPGTNVVTPENKVGQKLANPTSVLTIIFCINL